MKYDLKVSNHFLIYNVHVSTQNTLFNKIIVLTFYDQVLWIDDLTLNYNVLKV